MKKKYIKLLLAALMIGGVLCTGGCSTENTDVTDTLVNDVGREVMKDAVDKAGAVAKDTIQKYKDGEYDDEIESAKKKLKDASEYIKTQSKSDSEAGGSEK